MKFIQFLNEAPLMTDEYDPWDLESEKKRKSEYNKYEKMSSKEKSLFVKDDMSLSLYKISNRKSEFVLKNNKDKVIQYKSVVETAVVADGQTWFCQKMLWKDKNAKKGIAQDYFFDYVLKEFKYMCTDSVQTKEGKNYWRVLLNTAYKKGLICGVIKVGATTTLTEFTKNDMDIFFESMYSSQSNRLFIKRASS